MKFTLKIAGAWVVVATILYIFGAFVGASFDISGWSPDGRFLLGLTWFASSIALTMLIYMGEK